MKKVAFSAILLLMVFQFQVCADDIIPLILNYQAETYAYAYNILEWCSQSQSRTDNDNSINSLCQSQAWATATYYDGGPGVPDHYYGADSVFNAQTEGIENSGTVELKSKLDGWGDQYHICYECDPPIDETTMGSGEGNGYASLQGTLTVGQCPGYLPDTLQLTLQISADINGNSSSAWTSHNWYLKIWDQDPNAPLVVIDNNNLSAEIAVFSGDVLNVELYQTGAEDYWPTSGLSTTIDVNINLLLPLSIADIDGDASVDFIDYTIVANEWQMSADPCDPNSGDIVKDGYVDIYDLALLAENWLTCFVTSATEPVPADQAVDVNVNVVLQWSPGEKSTSHDVYFGTDFNEVNNADTANPSVYMGNQDANYWDTYYYNSSELDANTTYYWRIDEVAGCIAKGDVWSFNTNLMLPGQASNPIPSDGATGADLTTDLNWTAGDNATSHDVYFGTTNPPPFQVNQAGTTYDTGTMDPNTTYYWRIDEKNGNGITTGIDWSFRTAVDSNLVGWWKFDEGSGTIAYDSAGDNIGQLTNGPIWISGRIGGALSFDGVNDYVSVNDNASLDISSQLTISAWILIGAGNYDYTIVSKGDNYIFDTDPVSELSFKHGSSYYYSNSGLAYGAWQHVAVTVGSGQVKFYINGSLNKTLAQSGGFTVNNDPLRIGSSNRYFSGYIDDVRIYKRALTGSEIALLYQQGL